MSVAPLISIFDDATFSALPEDAEPGSQRRIV
jgi:hypothetical protein